MKTQKDKQKIVIVGKGAFGDLMAKYLRPYFSVQFIRRADSETDIEKKLHSCKILIFSVPMVGLEKSILRTKPFVSSETIIVDVTSVKIKPLALLKKYFKNNQVLGTHPILGPQSVKKNKIRIKQEANEAFHRVSGSSRGEASLSDLSGLPLVLCQETTSNKTYKKIKQFCKRELGLKVIEQTAVEHDTEMAHVQGLSHFIGRALNQLDIANYATNTESYAQLVELKDLLTGDSWDLFETIQNTNPEAKKVRKKFMSELEKIEKKLH